MYAILHELVDQQYSRMHYWKPEGVELRPYLCFQAIFMFSGNIHLLHHHTTQEINLMQSNIYNEL